MNKKLSGRELLANERLFHSEIYPNMIDRRDNEILFLLWRNNNLKDFITWSLFRDVQNIYYVRRVVWKQRSFYKLRDPDTFGAEYEIPLKLASSIIEELSNFEFSKPLPKSSEFTIDGIECGIKIGDTLMNWQAEAAPKKLTEFAIWHENTILQFEKLFL